MEIWKDIPGYENYYQVSNYGRVKSLDRIIKRGNNLLPIAGTIITLQTNEFGYQVLILMKNRNYKHFRVHRLVASVFLENPNELAQVNHIDCDKSNNHVDNLEWVSAKQNMAHSREFGSHKKYVDNSPSSKKVGLIVSGCLFRFKSASEAGNCIGVHVASIPKAIKRNTTIKSYKPFYIIDNQ